MNSKDIKQFLEKYKKFRYNYLQAYLNNVAIYGYEKDENGISGVLSSDDEINDAAIWLEKNLKEL